jgi:DnaJ-class molecular chaperone
MSNLYSILGVDRSASAEEIKHAYRKLAGKHHPDRGGDTKTFQEIQAAYDTLSDPSKRTTYDNPQPQGFPGGFHFQGGMPPEFEEIFSHFNQTFGGGFHRPTRNKNLNIQAAITLEEAFHGKEIFAQVPLPSGKTESLQIKIPPGVHAGSTLRLAGVGDNSIPNALRGDIYLNVVVHEHPEFIRNGNDLIKNIDINCLDAIIGTKVIIDTIDGKKLETTIPPGTQHGRTFAFHGYGMPNINDARMRGRFLITVNLVVPTNLSQEKQELIKTILKENV